MLDDAADPAQTQAVCCTNLADTGLNAIEPAKVAVLGIVVARVGVQLADGSTGDLGQAQQMPKEPRVVDVGGREDGAERQAVGGDDDVVLGLGLAAVGGVGTGQLAAALARTEQLSITTSHGARLPRNSVRKSR